MSWPFFFPVFDHDYALHYVAYELTILTMIHGFVLGLSYSYFMTTKALLYSVVLGILAKSKMIKVTESWGLS
jgi:hypothetical protein